MKIIIESDTNKPQKNISLQQLYNCIMKGDLTVTCKTDNNIMLILAWLPNITEIRIKIYYDNNYIDIVFNNGESVRLYNVGIESDLVDLIKA